MNKLWYLAQINLFDTLPMEDLRMIDAMAPMTTVKKGTVIIEPDSTNHNVYLLKQGRVRLFKITEEGKQLTLGLLEKGNIFGETDILSTGSGSAYVEAIDDALVCVLGRTDFEDLLSQRPALALKLLSILTERIREAEEMLENLAFRDVRYRLVYLLTKLAKNFGQTSQVDSSAYIQLTLNLSHQDLANMIGATRESVSGSLSQLAKEGVVITGRKTIAVDVKRADGILGLP